MIYQTRNLMWPMLISRKQIVRVNQLNTSFAELDAAEQQRRAAENAATFMMAAAPLMSWGIDKFRNDASKLSGNAGGTGPAVAAKGLANEQGGLAPRKAEDQGAAEGTGRTAVKGGEGRAAQYSSSWGNASVKEVVNDIAPGSSPVVTDTGKIIYKNAQTGKQVVYDIEGNYFRIEDTTMAGKRAYTDVNGNEISNNKVVNGKQTGISQGEYNQMTHYNNTDIDFPYDMK